MIVPVEARLRRKSKKEGTGPVMKQPWQPQGRKTKKKGTVTTTTKKKKQPITPNKPRKPKAKRRDRVLKLLDMLAGQPKAGDEEASVASQSELQAVVMSHAVSKAYAAAYTEMVGELRKAYLYKSGQQPHDRLLTKSMRKGRRVVMLQLHGQVAGMFAIEINLLNGKVLTVPALYVPPAYQGTAGGSDVARAALHLITTLALGMGVQRIKFLQGIDAGKRPDLVEAWEGLGVPVKKGEKAIKYGMTDDADVRSMFITSELAREMHERYTEEQLKLLEDRQAGQRGTS